MKAKKVKQMVIAALVACAGILASNAAVVASGEKEFALLPPVTLSGLSATAITVGQTLANSTISGTATTEDFGAVAGTFAWNSPTTAPTVSDSQTTAYAVTFTPTDPNHSKTGSATVKLTVNAKAITPAVTPSKASATYGDSGWSTLPTLTVTGDSKTLTSGTDYTAAWSSASVSGAGTYTVTVTLKGNYSGSQTATYAVNPREVTLAWGPTAFTYTGSAQKPTCTAGNLVSGDSCTVTVSGEQVAAGTGYTATATGLSNANYKLPSATTTTFSIGAKSVTPTLTASKTSVKYGDSGWNTLPTLTVTGDSKNLASGTDYTATWSPATLTGAGTYTVTVTLNGNYSGSQTATYTVNKRAVTLTSGTKQFFYDGQAHSNSTLKVSGDGFAAGEGVRGNSFATITEIGSTPNAFGYEFTGTGRAENYDVSFVQGTLTVIQYVAPSVEITSVRLADERDGTVEYSYEVDGTFGDKVYDVLIKVSVANGTKSVVLTNESVAVGSVSTNVNVKTLFGKAYPNVAIFAEIKKGLGGVQLWEGGPIFAEYNVGATKFEEAGYHFWWGDTIGYTNNGAAWLSVADGTQFRFLSNNATIMQVYGKSSETLFSEGWIDGNGNLVAEHDAATVHWGAPWRMMTGAEMKALATTNACSRMLVTEYKGESVTGYLVKGKAGTPYANSEVFFPVAGYGSDRRLALVGSRGYSWSSSAVSGSTTSSTCLDFGSASFICYGLERVRAMSVRPVRDAAK